MCKVYYEVGGERYYWTGNYWTQWHWLALRMECDEALEWAILNEAEVDNES